MKYILLTILLGFSITSPLKAQMLLYTNLVQEPISPLSYYNSIQTLDLNLDALKSFPDSIQLDFPDGTSTIVLKDTFNPRRGYYFRDDDDPVSTPDFWVDPTATPEEFSYMWFGSNDDYDIVLTVHNGQLIGTISGNEKRYVIEKRNGGGYQMIHLYLPGFPSRADDAIGVDLNRTNNLASTDNKDNTYISHLKSFDYQSKKHINSEHRGTTTTVLDVLIVYTELARIEAGGLAADPNDTQDIETEIITVIDNTNMAFRNSAMNTSVTKFHTAKLNGFSHQSNFTDTLNAFRLLPSLINLRNTIGADVVSGIIETDTSAFAACGTAYLQTLPGVDGSIVGLAFIDSVYSLVQKLCVIYDNTFTHELGHNMGASHARDELFPVTVTSIVDNGFPDAFAWRSGNFKSILSITQLTTSRRLNFSNPNVIVDGNITGVLNFANNARVIDQLTPVMSLYRERPDLIFLNGFD